MVDFSLANGPGDSLQEATAQRDQLALELANAARELATMQIPATIHQFNRLNIALRTAQAKVDTHLTTGASLVIDSL